MSSAPPRPGPAPTFRGLNPHGEVRIYRRDLPHWRQAGATYFVTFRQADSIPKSVLLTWQDEDRQWLAAHGIHGPLSDPNCQATFEALPEKERRAFEKRQGHRLHIGLDACHGSCLLRNGAVRDIVGAALQHYDGDRWWCGDWVLMPNHGHAILQPIGEHALEATLKSVKGYAAGRLTRESLKPAGHFWQSESYDHIVRDRKEMRAIRTYIAGNPEKAGLNEGEYTYYRAGWLDE
jgi:REP element-mobilizing transposase RayT